MISVLILSASMALNPDSLQQLVVTDTTVQQYIDLADSALAHNDLRAASVFYLSALQMEPGNEYATKQADYCTRNMGCGFDFDDAHQKIINHADGYFDSGKFQDAKKYYQKALTLKDNEYALNQVLRCNDSMRYHTPDCGDFGQYQKILDKADEYYQALNYFKAKELYVRANLIRPGDTLLMIKLEDCDVMLSQYGVICNAANGYYEEGNYKKAHELYTRCTYIATGDIFIETCLAECEQWLETGKGDDIHKQYDKLLKKANKHFEAGEYEEAKSIYLSLANVGSTRDQFIVERIVACDAQIPAVLTYENYIKWADAYFASGDYQVAKENYLKALEIIPYDQYCLGQARLCDHHIGLHNPPIMDEQYAKILAKADEYFQGADYVMAKEIYERALSVKPEDTFVKVRIAACDEKLKD